MLVTTKIKIDLQRPSYPMVVNAVQGEQNTRQIELSLYSGCVAWMVPDNVAVAMRYSKPDKTKGYYDTMPDGSASFTVSENRILAFLAPQMLTVPGTVVAQIILHQGTQTLATFSIHIRVEADPSAGAVASEDYVNWAQWIKSELDAYLEQLKSNGEFVGGTFVGDVNMNGHLIKGLNAPTESDQAANMGFVNEQVKKAAPYNYAHNSDFTQWVATKGIGGLHGVHAYAGDRWILDDGIVTGDAREDGNGYRNIKLNGTIRQKVANAPDVANAAIEMISGTANISYNNGEITITSSGGTIKNVLLCADETLPKYQPKGYGAELAECQRYYIKLGAETVCPGYTGSDGKQVWFHSLLPTTMRVTPTAVHSGGLGLRNINGPYNLSSYTIVSTIQSNNGVVIAIDQTETQLPPGVTCNVYIIGSMELLADIPENL